MLMVSKQFSLGLDFQIQKNIFFLQALYCLLIRAWNYVP